MYVAGVILYGDFAFVFLFSFYDVDGFIDTCDVCFPGVGLCEGSSFFGAFGGVFGHCFFDELDVFFGCTTQVGLLIEGDFHEFCAGGDYWFTYGEVFVDFPGVVADGDFIDELRIEADIKGLDVEGKAIGVFMPEKMYVGVVVEFAGFEDIVFGSYEDKLPVGSVDGQVFEQGYIEADVLQGAYVADDGMVYVVEVGG